MACCAREKDYEVAYDNDFASKGVVNGIPSRDPNTGFDQKDSKLQSSNRDWHAEQLAAQEEARRLAGQQAEASSPRSSYARDHVGPPKAQQSNWNEFVAGQHQVNYMCLLLNHSFRLNCLCPCRILCQN